MDFSMYGFEGLQKVTNLHPAFVHFPIALLPLTLLFYGFGVVLKKESLLVGGRVCLYASLASVIATVITGLRAEDTFPHGEDVHRMIETHQTTGYIIMGLLALLSGWSFWNRGQKPVFAWGFLLVCALGSYLVLQNGDIGSRMVYLHGAAVKPGLPAGSYGDYQHEHLETHAHEEEGTGAASGGGADHAEHSHGKETE